ncbi:gliding motility regulatory -like [Paramuricea clavata]|uniref:Gliding motility regulatory -like n=1 Tax=Paramuricea clavata TaxID=317549 RepID=A0A7D9E220_PARCT|nr:gliding motility regulatory -like [Paramuricea clavata]
MAEEPQIPQQVSPLGEQNVAPAEISSNDGNIVNVPQENLEVYTHSEIISLGKGPVNDYSRGILSNYVDRESRFILVVKLFHLARDQTLQRQYTELQAKVEALTTSSLDPLLMKIRNLASRSIAEFSRFEAMDLLEANKNTPQDNKYEKANYYKLTYETLRAKVNSSTNEQFRAFLLPLLGDKDQDIISRVEKNHVRRHQTTTLPPSMRRATTASPYRSIRCYYCQKFGHTRNTCYKLKRDQEQFNVTGQAQQNMKDV